MAMVSEIKSYLKPESQFSELPEIKIGAQGLRKRILHKGISWKTPSPGDEVQGS